MSEAPPFHPIANIFPLLQGREYQRLVDDIREHGLAEPIVLLDSMILDGRNRARACAEVGEEPIAAEFKGDDTLGYVISRNLRRRHLNASQRAMAAARTANLPGRGRPGKIAPIGAISQDQAAEMFSVSRRSLVRALSVLASERGELIDKVDCGYVHVSRAEKQIRDSGRRSEAQRIAESTPDATERYRLIQAPLTALLNEPAGSVDIICTDPPYPQEFLPLYAELSRVGAHLLRPGGVLICMCGQTWLPEVIAGLSTALNYHWLIAYLTPGGQAAQNFPRRANAFFKPVLIYTKGEYAGDWFGDVARSDTNANDKEHHHWGQSVSGMRNLMQRFVRPGHVVVDPFLGGGTTAVVALALGASFIGCDVDAAAIATTKARLRTEDHAAAMVA
jgi:hypothetical protein